MKDHFFSPEKSKINSTQSECLRIERLMNRLFIPLRVLMSNSISARVGLFIDCYASPAQYCSTVYPAATINRKIDSWHALFYG